MKITTKTHSALVKLAKYMYPDYKGRKFYVSYEKSVDTGYNANWCGGSRTYYKFVRMDNGKIMEVPDFAPWKRPENEIADIPQGCACVTHSFFCGHDCGITVILPVGNEII